MLLRREQDFELGSGFCCGGFVNRVTTKYFVQLTSEPSFGLLLRTEAVVQGIGITVDL
ncbi:hypothetical protein AGABI2DRAFT_189845 [Agaricus bisporus var. bisporus H97]|uniref:hypothetical protein n=1 Tax=Agaricus bisporus var. bisporus (strain H97 / ATCC MYA-4626 / FGSC 10389) TaxID=936046 RepID=UPI00029F663C|nr:hypothetical protein AGABI2DRAFT_189845 [Agaricus bisporus var. bisporus H97]EKV51615.1 hypothetical protein AGABI2DRAFT_189845 [Agaricus bisporus var. bisporus H97]